MKVCDKKKVREEFERNICEKPSEGRMRVGEGKEINDVFIVSSDAVFAVEAVLVGNRICKRQGKGKSMLDRWGKKKKLQKGRRGYMLKQSKEIWLGKLQVGGGNCRSWQKKKNK